MENTPHIICAQDLNSELSDLSLEMSSMHWRGIYSLKANVKCWSCERVCDVYFKRNRLQHPLY